MQRPAYSNPPPTPPLHHPVPQHVSTVPQLRSPPPPVSQQQQQPQQQYGYGHNPSGGGSGYPANPSFGGFMTEPTAQMGLQVGKSAFNAGQEYMEQNFNRYVNVSALKHYFNVSNSYVVTKLYIVLFPWRHRPWSRQQRINHQGQDGYFLPPREDVNSPDMYIPLMSLITYVLFSTLLAGIRGAFQPELLGSFAFKASLIVVFEILTLKLGCYLLNISNESQLFDLVAYSGYKFVGVIVTQLVAEIANGGQGTGGWIGWAVFAYTFSANAFFLLRSLKYVLLPDNVSQPGGANASYTVARAQRNRRTQFLFVYSYVVQLLFMWILCR
ncbi:YIF1-domain-containing protein [Eremomyces bilateralis CBS 781.70]|uniref:Protein YIF1 n=1 Tax=Eremomyces bilateralis CBS 781.70 TaxID=1392243 RepID=A0A6G1FSV4_9PEZI|nr:YIF1-domain-containing protein [Eremomyces bilateralis CBS 781.70]KAF1808762.1 YIF1-domain-containing protein [Eremomyces bilateralis CBS 781.70]